MIPRRTRSVCKPTPEPEPVAPEAEPHPMMRIATEAPVPEPTSDYPPPAILNVTKPFEWNEDRPAHENYRALAARLASAGDLFRNSRYAAGLLLASPSPNVPPERITDPARFAAVITDRLPVIVKKDGKARGNMVPSSHRKCMLHSEVFLQGFPALDLVTTTPLYIGQYQLTAPGYNDGGQGARVFYAGDRAPIHDTTDKVTAFLDVMPFASSADRTNTVAAALTVILRNLFPGSKPLVCVTANKSHAGKDTVVAFAAGRVRTTSVSYQATDWALERAIVGALRHNPETGLVNIENARLERGGRYIASAFVERFITDPEPLLFSTGTGGPSRQANNVVIAITTNDGMLNTDLLNRSLPIHLELLGNVEDRISPIGNPKLEYLPANVTDIEAELRGMIERWKCEGCPLDETTRHPFTTWAQVVGGILRVNGFSDFLANFTERRVSQDPLRRALGVLGAAMPDRFMRAGEWASLAVQLGVGRTLIGGADYASEKGQERGIGAVLSAHRDETVTGETESEALVLRLERARRRFENGEPSTRYRFVKTSGRPLPEDDESSASHSGNPQA